MGNAQSAGTSPRSPEKMMRCKQDGDQPIALPEKNNYAAWNGHARSNPYGGTGCKTASATSAGIVCNVASSNQLGERQTRGYQTSCVRQEPPPGKPSFSACLRGGRRRRGQSMRRCWLRRVTSRAPTHPSPMWPPPGSPLPRGPSCSPDGDQQHSRHQHR